jgi:hypothetical protein
VQGTWTLILSSLREAGNEKPSALVPGATIRPQQAAFFVLLVIPMKVEAGSERGT